MTDFIVAAPYGETPDTPDLGCTLKRYDFARHWDGPWRVRIDWAGLPSQSYIRVKCGNAGFNQRVLCYLANAFSQAEEVFANPPIAILGGQMRPRPSDWQKLPIVTHGETCWVFGQHFDTEQQAWRPNAAIGDASEDCENGFLDIVSWDDTGGDRDYNDMTVEVAHVFRRGYAPDPLIPQFEPNEVEAWARTSPLKGAELRPHRGFEVGASPDRS